MSQQRDEIDALSDRDRLSVKAKWDDPVDMDEEEDAVVIHRVGDPDYPDVRDRLSWDHTGAGKIEPDVEAEAPPAVVELMQRESQISTITNSPREVRRNALMRALASATAAAGALESSIEWLAVDDPVTAKEYTRLADEVRAYQERLSARYQP